MKSVYENTARAFSTGQWFPDAGSNSILDRSSNTRSIFHEERNNIELAMKTLKYCVVNSVSWQEIIYWESSSILSAYNVYLAKHNIPEQKKNMYKIQTFSTHLDGRCWQVYSRRIRGSVPMKKPLCILWWQAVKNNNKQYISAHIHNTYGITHLPRPLQNN